MTSSLLLLLTQAFLYFGVMAAMFALRHQIGFGVFICALGVMHFLETYLSAVFFVQLPFGLISPGSTVLFSGKLAIILLTYIREDAEIVRQPIYGLLIGNFLIVALVLSLRLYAPPVNVPGYNADLILIDQLAVLMIWGSLLLFIDSIILILLYEKLRALLPRSAVLRAGISLALILTFDQVGYFTGLHLVTGVPFDALIGGWGAKMGAAVVFSGLIGMYLTLFERGHPELAPQPVSDVFSKLTYRHRYEDLLLKSGSDALTGALTRAQFETAGEASLARALAAGRPVSLAFIDIDHFKDINDRYGHVAGDEVLRQVVGALRGEIRAADSIFRYGGEEFAVLCEGMAHEGALAQAERMRRAVEAMTDAAMTDEAMTAETLTKGVQTAHSPTISIGVATAPADAVALRDLVAIADGRLYEAKRLGRNRVVGRPDKAVVS